MNEYNPDWASPPYETVTDFLEENGIATEQLAIHMGWSSHELMKFIAGDMAVDEPMSLLLETFTGAPARFWMIRQQQFDEGRKKRAEQLHPQGYGNEKLPTDGSEIKDPEMVEIFLYENRKGHHHALVKYKGLEVRPSIEYTYRQPLHAKHTMQMIQKTLDLVRGLVEAMEEPDGQGREEEAGGEVCDAGAVEPVPGS